MKKLALAALAAAAALTVAPAAQAAQYADFESTPDGGFIVDFGFDDVPTVPSPFMHTFTFEAGRGFSTAGVLSVAGRRNTGNIDFTKVTFNGADFTTLFSGSIESRIFPAQLFAAGTQTLYVEGATNDNTGDYSGRLTFTPLSAVPEPAAWALMIGGFGVIGAGLRRSSRRTTVPFATA